MKTDKRKYKIRQDEYNEVNNQYFNPPLVLEYKGKIQVLNAGNADHIEVFRHGNDFAVLSTNYSLDYAGLDIVDFENNPDNLFFDNITERINEDISRNFWDYSSNTQADILAQYLPY